MCQNKTSAGVTKIELESGIFLQVPWRSIDLKPRFLSSKTKHSSLVTYSRASDLEPELEYCSKILLKFERLREIQVSLKLIKGRTLLKNWDELSQAQRTVIYDILTQCQIKSINRGLNDCPMFWNQATEQQWLNTVSCLKKLSIPDSPRSRSRPASRR